jgi:sterol desaturase/sphingolipid hydroxylase (fatty acid hydroxylase superfamily)
MTRGPRPGAQGGSLVSHAKIVHSKEPIRLFKSDFLEFFTHIHPAVVLVIWLPITGYFLYRATLSPGLALRLVLGIPSGLFLWTLVEYVVHRFVFHFPPHTPRQERISFLFHGVHHAQPMEKSRLVMPPVVSIPLATICYAVLYVTVGVLAGARAWVSPVFAGLLLGYVTYDMTHYATHHFKIRWRVFQYIRRYHLHHHTQTPNQRFGVTSPLWDIVFGTKPD